MLSGDNSILQKATTAKTNTDNAQIKERVQLAYTAAIADGKGKLTEQNLRTELTNEFGDDYYLSEDTTTNEWVISVNEIERLRVIKPTIIEKNSYGLSSDRTYFIGQKATENAKEQALDNSQTSNLIADETGYRFETGHFIKVDDYEYYYYETNGFVNGTVYFCWDAEGVIPEERESTPGTWDIFSPSGTFLGSVDNGDEGGR